MILQLLPPVTKATPVLPATAIPVSFNIFLGFPARTLLRLIVVQVWWSPIVLPVMCIDTLIPQVVLVTEGTPNRLKMKQIEICVTVNLI